MRYPKVIEAFCGKKIIDFAVGSVHCLAVTEDGEVYSWGWNEQGQLGDTSCMNKAEPTLISSLAGKEITGVACGPAQVGHVHQRVDSESQAESETPSTTLGNLIIPLLGITL